ncbi:MAG: hypothetical protein AB8G22_09150 [Saprospiraceae bacterium]
MDWWQKKLAIIENLFYISIVQVAQPIARKRVGNFLTKQKEVS